MIIEMTIGLSLGVATVIGLKLWLINRPRYANLRKAWLKGEVKI